MTRLMIHADDVGMCHGANSAFVELSNAGSITCGSVMVPCPWFAEIASIAAADASLDLGVHLTLNSEKPHYRWAPVSRAGRSSGLVDDGGFMWRDVATLRRHADPGAVEGEWRAQIDRALTVGIDVTHLDAHMGSALAPEWCEAYIRVGLDYRLPVLITSTVALYGPNNHLAGFDQTLFEPFVAQARAAGLPVFDRVLETNFDRPADLAADYPTMLTGLTDDLVFCAFHPCVRSAGEIEVIEPDQFHVRTDEYELFRQPSWRAWLAEQQFELIGMRELRDHWRSAHPA